MCVCVYRFNTYRFIELCNKDGNNYTNLIKLKVSN